MELAWEITGVVIRGGEMNFGAASINTAAMDYVGLGWLCWPVEKQSGPSGINQNQGSMQRSAKPSVLEIVSTVVLILVSVLVGGWRQMQGRQWL